MRLRALLVPVASLSVISGVVLQSSTAAFTATTDTTGGWAAGTISLADDDSGTALFAETGLAPGAQGQKCIKVTYTGSPAATVKLYGAVLAPASGRVGGLAPYLTLTITRGTGGNATCADFAPAATGSAVFAGTLDAFRTSHGDWATGAGAVAVANGEAHTYQVAWRLSSDSAAQGKDVDARFTWEAQTA